MENIQQQIARTVLELKDENTELSKQCQFLRTLLARLCLAAGGELVIDDALITSADPIIQIRSDEQCRNTVVSYLNPL